ncbi:hypothetical protein F442_22166 [Phytophthora nicotianae P10297]|uniref:RxLR effector protein n=1 Tax=Phytophthora nicotianae P10297 TaxID=1317064 RepID=W2Y1C8_PHYNI|nr:hypothetical protein F442_22166 [Phytophthora nicotianae P10297]
MRFLQVIAIASLMGSVPAFGDTMACCEHENAGLGTLEQAYETTAAGPKQDKEFTPRILRHHHHHYHRSDDDDDD